MQSEIVRSPNSATITESSLDLLDDTFERHIREAVRRNGFNWVMALASEERDNVICEAHIEQVRYVGPTGRKHD